MSSVFLLWHVHELAGESDEKLIGVYESRSDAKAAVGRLSRKPGFRNAPDGFVVDKYMLGKDHWTEGYVTVTYGRRRAKRKPGGRIP